MKTIMLSLLAIISIISLNQQKMSPEQIVQKQLETYNARDIEGFMALMAEDVGLYNLGEAEPISSGHAAVKAIYKNLFEKSPRLNSVLANRIVMGNTVIDHERITGRMGNEEVLELSVIYEVSGQKIQKITVIRK